jgi:hypothetical protein
MNTLNLFGERSLTLVAASFLNGNDADRAAGVLRRALPAGSVDVLRPSDADASRKMAPDPSGIWRTLVRTHLLLGVVGPVVGVLVAFGLWALGWPALRASPWLAMLFLGLLGGFVGMMAAGLLSLRPDQSRVILHVRERMRRGRWAVVAHPRDRRQAVLAQSQLEMAGGEVMRSF